MQRLKKRGRLIAIILILLVLAGAAASIASEAAEYTVTNRGSASDGMTTVGRFSIDGNPVFCCDHIKVTPPTGTKVIMSEGNNADIAKTLYYGYGGPGQWSGFSDTESAIVATSLVLDHYFNNGTGNGNPNYAAFKKFLDSKDTTQSGTSYILYTSSKSSHQRLVAVNPAVKVSVTVTKESADKTFTEGNACYSLKGAEYGIYSGNTLLETMITDEKGRASSNITVSPEAAKDIIVKEIKSSDGYVRDEAIYVKDGSSGKINIISKEPPVRNPAEIALYKYDSETGKKDAIDGGKSYSPQKGASLEGAVFKVDFYGMKKSDIPSDKDFSKFKALRTWYFRTDEEGKVKWESSYLAKGYEQSELYHNPSDKKDPALPLGVIAVREIKAPKGYLLNEEVNVSFITAEGESAEVDVYQAPEVPNNIKRGDLKFNKIAEGSNKRMSGIPFSITALQDDGKNVESGEQHIIVTDENGYASTEDSFNPHSEKMNINDKAWDGKSFDDSKIDFSAGIWFGEQDALKSDRGALPYGRYRIDELPCRNNEGYKLLEGIEIEVSRDSHTIEMGTLTNRNISIKTNVWDSETNEERITFARDSVTLTDRVSYKGLEKGEEYTLKGILMDKMTGNPFLEKSGREVTCEKTFIAKNTDGKIDMQFKFDASSLKGKQIVVFETMMKGAVIVAKHEDIDDLDQTMEFLNPEIRTKAKIAGDEDEYSADGKNITIIDSVHYSGLLKGHTYEIKGVLMDKVTGKPVLIGSREVIAQKKFEAEKSEGEVEIEFSFNPSSYKGKDIVVFEELIWAGSVIADHKDINDENQTVSIETESGNVTETGDIVSSAAFISLIIMTAVCIISVLTILSRKREIKK